MSEPLDEILWPCDLKHSGDRLLTSLKSGDLEAVELSDANSCIVSGDARGTVFKKGCGVCHTFWMASSLGREQKVGGPFCSPKRGSYGCSILLYYIYIYFLDIIIMYIFITDYYIIIALSVHQIYEKLIGFIHALQ